ncbi:glycosyltransferase family 4 protein [Aeoliella mucimassa]|uniref:GDP-mannose-dependent alpha-(1-6)-phosphatidylinositol monomannoside mannosyltransferase n=1 Tax=Aeoliella mucimassa TaxID=2527972 RepID=A0A518AVR4_9BACT|nr:glycosyltransferase family 4 protein [Aeoliella mucimassa]QDU58825.1 GDP-mannose-dependent alpha-(1-6)-phosphatidylinositol monomannoside mannosyltransferase [Aeoliella mucimassa]
MIRIAITQPDIRPYRVPVYNLLASQPDIEVTVFADLAKDAPNPEKEDIRFRFEPATTDPKPLGPLPFVTHSAHHQVNDPAKFDFVIHSWNPHYRSLRPALKQAKKLGIPTLVWGHGYSKRDSWFRTMLRNWVARPADGILLYTHPIAQRMIDKYGFDAERVFVAQNAIDQTPIQAAREAWLADPERLAQFQAEHELVPGRTVVFVSRLLDENRPDRLVRAIDGLRHDYDDCKLVIVGDGPERPKLEALAEQLNVADRVIFTGAIYDEYQMAPWLLSSGVFCYPENVGLSLLTAFGFGLPAVTSDNIEAQNPEVVALQHGKNGLLYPYGNEQAMIDALGSVLGNDEFRESLAAEALRTVTEEFTLATMVQGFLDATRLVDGKTRKVVLP